METRPVLLSIKDQLENSQRITAERNALIAELKSKNDTAKKEISAREKQIDFLFHAQEVEQRIFVLLTYLNQRPDEDRHKLLLQERETQKTVLSTLEDLCKSTA